MESEAIRSFTALCSCGCLVCFLGMLVPCRRTLLYRSEISFQPGIPALSYFQSICRRRIAVWIAQPESSTTQFHRRYRSSRSFGS